MRWWFCTNKPFQWAFIVCPQRSLCPFKFFFFFFLNRYCTVVTSVKNNCSQAKRPLCSSYLCPPLSFTFPLLYFPFFLLREGRCEFKEQFYVLCVWTSRGWWMSSPKWKLHSKWVKTRLYITYVIGKVTVGRLCDAYLCYSKCHAWIDPAGTVKAD